MAKSQGYEIRFKVLGKEIGKAIIKEIDLVRI